jgi:Protein of unknown function DUF262/HNH endonuclease
MAKRVNLDAMIPREDFGRELDEEIATELIRDFPISHLTTDSPVRKQLRKPDFQRETNHWTPEQVVTFVASFIDQEVIPSLILWKSPSFIFVIDGGHRLSALRAWIEDDYGDGPISREFYQGEISDEQKRIAKRTRDMIEKTVGRFSTLRALVGSKIAGDPQQARRAGSLFTRPLTLQWVLGSPQVAETSFFKINSQGTPLDETEEMLIKNRRKPIAIGARAILRAGAGHKYWSAFGAARMLEIEALASEFYQVLFEPEVREPLKTLDMPLGGTVSPVDALSLLIEFLTVAGSRDQSKLRIISDYADDAAGQETVGVLNRALEIARRITGNQPPSLGLHPAVYFYNEKGKHSRFLFLGMVLLITEKVRNNDDGWFAKFIHARERVERFLIDNKSLIGILLQNMSKGQRMQKMRDLFAYLVAEINAHKSVTVEGAIAHLGLRGRIIDVNAIQQSPSFSDDTKSMVFVRTAIEAAVKCPICKGLLDPAKSVSYDHVIPIIGGGTGDHENAQLVHPYCNSLKGHLMPAESSVTAQ